MHRSRIFPGSHAYLIFLASLLAPPAGQAAAPEPWNLPALSASPEAILKAAAAQPAPKDGDIEMLFEEHAYKLDEQGRQHRIARRVYRYLTEKGVDDWSSTEADWSPWCEEKPVFRVRVITPDGQAHALDPESIGEAPAEQDSPNLFSDDKLLRAPLPAIVVGAVVEEEIETREVRSLFDHGIVERFLLDAAVPGPQAAAGDRRARRAAAEIRSDQQRRQAGPHGGRRPHVAGLRARPAARHALARTLSAGRSDEDRRRSSSRRASRGPTWPPPIADLVESQLDLETVRPLVEKAIGKETDRDKIIELLLASLRSQIRYTGIEFGKGAIVPRSSRETLTRRYGDCKDQATLLVAMLRVAGIKAHVALLRTGPLRRHRAEPAGPGRLRSCHRLCARAPGDSPILPRGHERVRRRLRKLGQSAPCGSTLPPAAPRPAGCRWWTRIAWRCWPARDPRTGPHGDDGLQGQHQRASHRTVSRRQRQGPRPRHGLVQRLLRRGPARRLRQRWASRTCGSAGRTIFKDQFHVAGLAAAGIQPAAGPDEAVPRHGRGGRRADRPVRRDRGHDHAPARWRFSSGCRTCSAASSPRRRGRDSDAAAVVAAGGTQRAAAASRAAPAAIAVPHHPARRLHAQGTARIVASSTTARRRSASSMRWRATT